MLPSLLSPLLLVASGWAVNLVSARHLPVVESRAINTTSILDTLSDKQRNLFKYSMEAMDTGFDASTQAFIFDSPRYSAWYAVGLLARNEGNDTAVAATLIQAALDSQFTNASTSWFGTFKANPFQPEPSSTVYPPNIYNSWDPNIALFVTSSWIIAMENFQHLLEPSLIEKMRHSMYIATVGDGYRVGGDPETGDNLYPVYSNPWFMRVICATYVGNMVGDQNMSYWGDHWAQDAIDLFDIYDTVSERNSGTYTGVTLYALALAQYAPKNSTIYGRAGDMITKTWLAVGDTYNPTLTTLGGAWDRTYGFDLRKYFGILGAQITGLIGMEGRYPLPKPLVGSAHYEDAAILALIPLISPYHDSFVPDSVVDGLTELHTPFSSTAQGYSPPFDRPGFGGRNYTTFTGDGISVGGMTSDEELVGGPSINLPSFSTGVILWDSGYSTAWISHYPSSPTIHAIATPDNLTISYPPSQAFPSNTTSNHLTLSFSALATISWGADFMSTGKETLPGLEVSLGGNIVESNSTRLFSYNAAGINGFPYYNLTYVFPDDFVGIPTLVLSFTKLAVNETIYA